MYRSREWPTQNLLRSTGFTHVGYFFMDSNEGRNEKKLRQNRSFINEFPENDIRTEKDIYFSHQKYCCRTGNVLIRKPPKK
jgi:hypothetical protein